MLVDFSVQNYRSIKDLQTLAMNAANIVSRDKELDQNSLIPFSPKLSLLKSKALYGANASGKSTIIRALSTFVSIVYNSVKDEQILYKLIDRHLLSSEKILEPTYFQISFIYKNTLYRYGFEATTDEIVSEWLFGTPGKKEVPFFTREGQDIKVNEHQFQEGAKVIDLYKQSANDIARKNSLFLTAVRSFNQGLAWEIINYLGNYIIISGLYDPKIRIRAEQSIEDEATRTKIAAMLKIADVGINDITREEKMQENPSKEKEYYTLTQHQQFDQHGKPGNLINFHMLTMESEGTKKMFEIGPALLQSLDEGRLLVMDEFDARFHPLLARKIVELYNSSSNKYAQFIFATHDTNLLTNRLLRRDQICFVEKDQQGASHFYSLADFKGVRNDASYEKDYVAGKYGAIPFLGDFKTIFEE